MNKDKCNVVNTIINLYNMNGSKYYIKESITQMEHAIQSALYSIKYDNDNLTVASLLHDIGHLLYESNEQMIMNDENLGVKCHELIGYEYLKINGFNEEVCVLVRNHVNSKRYLATLNENYGNTLSEASKKTLIYQGGLMTDMELLEFENDKYYNESILLRYCDDNGKNIDMELPNFESYYNLIYNAL